MAGLDINKIIAESVQDTTTNDDYENINEGAVYHGEESNSENDEYSSNMYEDDNMIPAQAVASSISAGLGALSLRNKLRAIGEGEKLKKAAKVGAGAAALGAAGYAAYKNKEELGDMAEKGKQAVKSGYRSVRDKITGGSPTTTTEKVVKTIAPPQQIGSPQGGK